MGTTAIKLVSEQVSDISRLLFLDLRDRRLIMLDTDCGLFSQSGLIPGAHAVPELIGLYGRNNSLKPWERVIIS